MGWSIELLEFSLCYEPRGLVWGQHLADFVVELPTEEGEMFRWKLFVDGSSNKWGGGAGIVLEGPDGLVIEQSLIFKFKVSNNQAEYEALLAGMKLARDLGDESLECRTDSQLVEGQMRGNFQIKDDQLLRYCHKAKQLEASFVTFELKHVPRTENTRVDILSNLANVKEKGNLSSVVRQVLTEPVVSCFNVDRVSGQRSWKDEVIQQIRKQEEGGSLNIEDSKKIARYCLVC